MKISLKQLNEKITHLNDITEHVRAPWHNVDGRMVANVGTYVLNGAYGGYQLGQLTNEGGGQKTIIEGYRSKRELWEAIDILEKGMRIAKGERV